MRVSVQNLSTDYNADIFFSENCQIDRFTAIKYGSDKRNILIFRPKTAHFKFGTHFAYYINGS